MSNPIQFYELDKMEAAMRETLLSRTESDITRFIEGVKPIIEKVQKEGDDALVHYARELDKAEISKQRIKAQPEDFERAFAALEPDLIETIEFAADRIKKFHSNQMPETMRLAEQFRLLRAPR